jgi:hypothetical protein
MSEANETAATTIDRDEAIRRIKDGLKRRSGKAWSVRGGRGTAWGWISVDAVPKRRTWHYVPGADGSYADNLEADDPSKPYGHMGPADRAELAELLGLDGVHYQGHSIPASGAHYREYVDRAEGREPSVEGERYWD